MKLWHLSPALLPFLLPCLGWAASPAADLYKQAQKAERAGQTVQAYLLYAEAAAAQPSNPVYWSRAMALRPVADLSGGAEGTGLPETAANGRKLEPGLFGPISDRDLEDARKPLPPAELSAVPGQKDFNLRGSARQIFEEVARAFGLMAVFDSDFKPEAQLRFQLHDAGYRDALRAAENATGAFLIPVSERLIFVAADTNQKRQEFERDAAAVIPVPEAIGAQEIQEIVTAVRGAMDIQRILVDSQRRLVLLRDRASKVRAARVLFEDLMRPRSQVAIEIQILTADENSSLSYGLSLPASFPLVSFGPKPRNLLAAFPAGFLKYLTFGGGASLLALGVTNASLFAHVSKASSRTLLSAEVTTVDGQPASLHVGEKYPIATNQYIGNVSGGGHVFTPPPTFNFEDLGLVLKITPRVHGAEGVTLDIDAGFKLLGAGSYNGIPVIASRKFESKVRVMAGEWAVLTGLMTGSEARTITGIPGLAAVPLLRLNQSTRDRSQTLIVLKPHILTLPPSELPTRVAWIGTESRPRTL